jgi:hypothetical protein
MTTGEPDGRVAERGRVQQARSGGAAGQSTRRVRFGGILVPPLGRHFGADARM